MWKLSPLPVNLWKWQKYSPQMKLLGMVDYAQAKMNAGSLAEAWEGWNLFYGGVSW